MMRVKIEINTREHFYVLDLEEKLFAIDNRWPTAEANIITYQPEELLGTKLRALYQRKKGRDLFDLQYALLNLELETDLIIRCFWEYMKANDNTPPTAREFELNMEDKMNDREFIGDIEALLRPEIAYNPEQACENVYKTLIQNI